MEYLLRGIGLSVLFIYLPLGTFLFIAVAWKGILVALGLVGLLYLYHANRKGNWRLN
jgi:hypothetical protein